MKLSNKISHTSKNIAKKCPQKQNDKKNISEE